jgi:hypothetical protein
VDYLFIQTMRSTFISLVIQSHLSSIARGGAQSSQGAAALRCTLRWRLAAARRPNPKANCTFDSQTALPRCGPPHPSSCSK